MSEFRSSDSDRARAAMISAARSSSPRTGPCMGSDYDRTRVLEVIPNTQVAGGGGVPWPALPPGGERPPGGARHLPFTIWVLHRATCEGGRQAAARGWRCEKSCDDAYGAWRAVRRPRELP